jgi:hypothetical protein
MPDIAPEKVIINGVEYDPGDAQQLIDLGSKTRDFEKQWNTDLSKVMPDYTRTTQELSTTKKELESRDQRLKEFEEKARQAETPAEKTNALKAARELGLLDQETAKSQFLTKDQLDSYFSTKQKEQQDTQTLIDTGKRLETEIKGDDGRVPYNSKAVLAYASSYGFFDGRRSYEQSLKDAYEEMAGSQNESWKQQQLDAARRPGLTTLKGQGSKLPAERKITTEQEAKEAMNEILWGGQE